MSPELQGSIAGIAGADGALLAIDSYDEYGIPAAGNLGRFQYTGHAWVAELKMYYLGGPMPVFVQSGVPPIRCGKVAVSASRARFEAP